MDADILRVWQIVHELSEQIAQNQKLASSLVSQAGGAKDQATELVSSGFNLRRYNVDISKETFDSEVERTNASVIIENQSLVNENKQLSLLLKEYENTMETIMAKFRTHAVAAQRHEHTLTQHYETLLQTRETSPLSSDLASAPETRLALTRLTHHLRGLLRSMAGLDPEPIDSLYAGTELDPDGTIDPISVSELFELLDALDDHLGEGEGGYDGSEGKRLDWAVEREKEIERLQKENEELRRTLGIDVESLGEKGIVVDVEEMRRVTTGVGRMLHNNNSSSGPGSRIGSHMAMGGGVQNSGSPGALDNAPRRSYWEPPEFGGQPRYDFKKAMELATSSTVAPLGGSVPVFLPGTRRPGMFGAGRGNGLRGPGTNLGAGNGTGAGGAGSPGAGPAPGTPTPRSSFAEMTPEEREKWAHPDTPGPKWLTHLMTSQDINALADRLMGKSVPDTGGAKLVFTGINTGT